MHQFLVNIKDDSKANVLLNFLKSLNYISVKELSDNDIIVSEEEKNVSLIQEQEDFIVPKWHKKIVLDRIKKKN